MKSMKDAVPVETGAIRKRTIRSLAMGRIDSQDCDRITGHLDAIDQIVRNMKERKE